MQMNMQDMYHLECYENAAVLSKNDCNFESKIEESNFKYIRYQQYIEDTSRQLNKMRLLDIDSDQFKDNSIH